MLILRLFFVAFLSASSTVADIFKLLLARDGEEKCVCGRNALVVVVVERVVRRRSDALVNFMVYVQAVVVVVKCFR